MAHNGEVVSYQGTSSLHVARFAKRSEADAAFDALGFHYASVLFKKDSHGWWSVAKTYGLQRTVDSLIAARGRERDVEDASTDDQAAEHVTGARPALPAPDLAPLRPAAPAGLPGHRRRALRRAPLAKPNSRRVGGARRLMR